MNADLVKQQIARIHSATSTGTLDLATVQDACSKIEQEAENSKTKSTTQNNGVREGKTEPFAPNPPSAPGVVAKPFTPTPLPPGFKPNFAPKSE